MRDRVILALGARMQNRRAGDEVIVGCPHLVVPGEGVKCERSEAFARRASFGM